MSVRGSSGLLSLERSKRVTVTSNQPPAAGRQLSSLCLSFLPLLPSSSLSMYSWTFSYRICLAFFLIIILYCTISCTCTRAVYIYAGHTSMSERCHHLMWQVGPIQPLKDTLIQSHTPSHTPLTDTQQLIETLALV